MDGKLFRTAIAVLLVSFSEAKRTVAASLTPSGICPGLRINQHQPENLKLINSKMWFSDPVGGFSSLIKYIKSSLDVSKQYRQRAHTGKRRNIHAERRSLAIKAFSPPLCASATTAMRHTGSARDHFSPHETLYFSQNPPCNSLPHCVPLSLPI